MNELNEDPNELEYATRAAQYLAAQGLETDEVVEALVTELEMSSHAAHQIASRFQAPHPQANAA